MSSSSSCVRLAAIHPCNHHLRLAPPPYIHANLTPFPIRASCRSFPNPLLITQKHKLQFLSPKTLQNPNFITSYATTTSKISTEITTSSEITSKIPKTEILILVFVYINPFLNRLNLLAKFPFLRLAMNPILPLIGFYQSIPTLALIAFLALFIGFVRYGWDFSKPQSPEAIMWDCLVVIASLIRPILVNPDPLAGGGALAFKFRLLNVLKFLSFQTCVLTCLKYLEAVPWRAVLCRPPSAMDTLANILKTVLKTDEDAGGREGKSIVVKLLRENDSLLTDVNSAETCNKIILSSCGSCLDSLLKLFKRAARFGYQAGYHKDEVHVDLQISLVANNLLWLLDILVDRQAAEEFALMWANQQKLADLHAKFYLPSRHLLSCITTRLLVGIGNGEILPANGTRRLLLLTWFQPLVYDYICLLRLASFDPKVVEENIERTILELTLEDQQRILLEWLGCVWEGDTCPNLRKAFEGWCRRTFSKPPSQVSFSNTTVWDV